MEGLLICVGIAFTILGLGIGIKYKLWWANIALSLIGGSCIGTALTMMWK